MAVSISGSGAITGMVSADSSDLSTALAAKAPLASPTFTGNVTIPGMPYKMAAGNVSASSAGTTVTFPTSRFSVAPRVVLGPGHVSASGGKGNAVVVVYASTSATGVTLASVTADSIATSWLAVQMTSSSADG